MSKGATAVESGGAQTTAESKLEKWISQSFANHNIIVVVDGKPRVVTFKDYALELDLSDKDQRKVSEALRASGRAGRDIFVVGEAYSDEEVKQKAEMLKTLRSMDTRQLRAMLTVDELMDNGIPTNTVDHEELIAVILKLKSFKD